jgi:uncharacterized membrane protein YeaQ/YmgE (transglycosylase-associated protein family)
MRARDQFLPPPMIVFPGGVALATCMWPGRTLLLAARLGSVSLWELRTMSVLWIILIGFVAGILAKLITPGNNEPQGFILTTILGIVGAFVASYLGQAAGWYRPGEGAGLIGAVLGAVIVLLIWGLVTGSRRTNLSP